MDVSTITRTIAKLKANGVNTKLAILDAGYYTGINANVLLNAKISFVARCKDNFKVYQDVVKSIWKNLKPKKMPLYATYA